MKFSVDQFRCETEDQSEWQLSGWAYLPGRQLARGVAMLNGAPIAQVFCGWPRPDVLAAFPSECPSENVGFQGHVILPAGLAAGRHTLDVTFFDELGQEAGHIAVPFTANAVTSQAPNSAEEPRIDQAHPQRGYLDLLEKTLLGLNYTDEAEANLRQEGRDWPKFAHTMIGQARLVHLRACAETVLRENVPGDFMETGVWRGGACILLRGVLKAYVNPDRKVWLADSFQGLPKPNPLAYPADEGDNLHSFTELAVSLEQVKSNFRSYDLLDTRVKFLKGWFSETLPNAPVEQLALLRLDGDMYESTMDALKALYPKLSPGGFCIIDDYAAIPACRQAVRDYRKEHGIDEPISMIDWTGAWWRKSGPLITSPVPPHVSTTEEQSRPDGVSAAAPAHRDGITFSGEIPLGKLVTSLHALRTSESAWIEHVPFAFWIVEHLKPASVVELGVHRGVSYCAFCQAVAALRLKTRCHGIDTFEGDAQAGFYGREILADLRAHHDPLYASFSELRQGTFDSALADFADGTIDLLHIDGGHAYLEVKHDFETWLPKLSRRAVVLLHDTREFGRNFGVWRFWSELAKSHPSFEFHHGHGLGVLAVGEDLPPALMSLFNAPRERQDSTRHLFSALGERLALKTRKRETPALNDISSNAELLAASDKLDALSRQQSLLQQTLMDAANARELARGQRPAFPASAPETLGEWIASQHEQMNDLRGELRATNGKLITTGLASRWVASFPWLVRLRTRGQRRLIRRSGLFDPSFYQSQLPAGFRVRDPLAHYLSVGWRCGLSPHRLFDVPWHQRAYQAALGDREPLSAYLDAGWQDNRRPHPLFDPQWYGERYPDVASKKRNPLLDYLRNGLKKKRWPNPHFDAGAYIARFGHLMSHGQTPLEHYLASGDPVPSR